MIKVESSMNFIVDNYTYVMQDDSFYNSISSEKTKDVDFIMKRKSKLLFIEAKTSSPRILDEYTDEISLKFFDSLIIFIGTILDRKKTKSTIITSEMQDINHLKGDIQFILIIKKAEKKYLPPIRDALNQKNKKIKSLFSLENDVLVMNESQAISRGFCQE